MVEPWSAVPEWMVKAEGDWEALEIHPGFETSAEEQAELVELASHLRRALRILLGSEEEEG